MWEGCVVNFLWFGWMCWGYSGRFYYIGYVKDVRCFGSDYGVIFGYWGCEFCKSVYRMFI